MIMATVKKIMAKFMNRNERNTSVGPTTAIQQFNEIFKFINSLAYCVGIELTSHWKFNARAKASLLMNAWMSWEEIYSVYLLFPSIIFVELSAGSMFLTTVITKVAFFVFNHGRFMSLVDFIFKLVNQNNEGQRQRILLDTASTIFYHFKLVIGGLFLGVAVYMCYPFYDYFFNGKLTPISPLIFPFANDGSTRSFLIGSMCNFVPPAWNIIGVAAVSCIFMTFVDVYASLVSLIDDDFHKFDDLWTRQHQDVNQRKVVFRNIMMEIMDLARYNFAMNQLFSLITTIQIGCCFLGISTLLFGYLANNYFGGVGGAAYFMTELMMFCFIGQLIDNQTQRIEMIIFHSDWYIYDVHYQKDLLFALCIVQNLKSTAVAGIMPLNFEAGVQVTKNIYSIIMFLLEALE